MLTTLVHRRRVAISREIMASMLSTGQRFGGGIVAEGLPAGAVLVDAAYDPAMRAVVLTVESPDFDPAPDDGIYPLVDIVIKAGLGRLDGEPGLN